MTENDETKELIKKHQELELEYQKYSDKLNTIKFQILGIKKKIQSICDHEWTTDLQPYQKEVYCKKCNLFDWDKTKYY